MRPPAATAGDWRTIDRKGLVRRAPVAGGEIGYADVGAGEPAVVLIHGLGAQWRVWLQTIPAVAAHRRVIVPDLPGFGDSTQPVGPVSVPGFADALEDLCEQVGVGPIVAVGNSLGGCVAAQLALSHPERVERLMLVNAVGIVPTIAERARTLPYIWAGAMLGTPMAGARRQIAARPGLRRAALGRMVHRPDDLDPDFVYHGMLRPPGPGTRDAIGAGLAHMTPEWEDSLERIGCRTLVVWGENDLLLPMRHAETWARRIPGARLITFEGTGHVPMVERPALFNKTLLEFIE